MQRHPGGVDNQRVKRFLFVMPALLLVSCGDFKEVAGTAPTVAATGGTAPVLSVRNVPGAVTYSYAGRAFSRTVASGDIALEGWCPGPNTVNVGFAGGSRSVGFTGEGTVALAQGVQAANGTVRVPVSMSADFTPCLTATSTSGVARIEGGAVVVTGATSDGTVTVRAGSATATSAFTVAPPVTGPAITVAVREGSGTVTVGQTLNIAVDVTARAGVSRELRFESDNQSVATVSPDGTVTGRSAGQATVTVSALADPTARAFFRVTVTEARGFTIEALPGSFTVQQGGSANMIVTLRATGGYTGSPRLLAGSTPGLSVSFSAPVLTPGAPVTVTVRGDAAGTHALTLFATDGSVTAEARAVVTVIAPGGTVPPPGSTPTPTPPAPTPGVGGLRLLQTIDLDAPVSSGVVAHGGNLYVGGAGSGFGVQKLGPNGERLAFLPSGGGVPRSLFVQGGRLYAATAEPALYVYDLAGDRQVGSGALPGRPTSEIVAWGGALWVGTEGGLVRIGADGATTVAHTGAVASAAANSAGVYFVRAGTLGIVDGTGTRFVGENLRRVFAAGDTVFVGNNSFGGLFRVAGGALTPEPILDRSGLVNDAAVLNGVVAAGNAGGYVSTATSAQMADPLTSVTELTAVGGYFVASTPTRVVFYNAGLQPGASVNTGAQIGRMFWDGSRLYRVSAGGRIHIFG